MEVIPEGIVAGRRAELQGSIDQIRKELENILNNELNKFMESLPEELRALTLGQFLALVQIVNEEPSDANRRKRKRTILGLDSEEVQRLTLADSGRRVTRSMAARQRQDSLGGTALRTSNIFADVPATPKLFAGLPETPAAIRQQLKKNPGARPVRIAGSTIRTTNITSTACVDSGKENKAPNPAVQNLIHMELSDGKIVDLDLTKSPGSVLSGVGAEKTHEVKEWLSQYASAFTSFLKRLGA